MVYLIGFVEKQAKVREDNPEFLPAIAILKLSEQIAAELVYCRLVEVVCADAYVSMPAHVYSTIGPVLLDCRVGVSCRLVAVARKLINIGLVQVIV